MDQELSLFPGEMEVRKAKAGDKAWRGAGEGCDPWCGTTIPRSSPDPDKEKPTCQGSSVPTAHHHKLCIEQTGRPPLGHISANRSLMASLLGDTSSSLP